MSTSTSTAPTPAHDAAGQQERGLPGLLYGETEEELRAAVRGLFEERAGWSAVLARTETSEPYDSALWRTLAAEVGCAGLLIPESHGGAGASYREAAVVAEEAGRAVAPVPYLGSAVVATAAALAAGDAELLSGLAGATVTAALAVPFASKPGASRHGAGQPGAGPALTVRVAQPQPGDPAGQARLTGVISGVADALPASVLLVPADGVPAGLYAVDAGAPGADHHSRGLAGPDPRPGRRDPGRRAGPAAGLGPGRGPRRRQRAGRRGRDAGRRAARGGRALPGDDRHLPQGAVPVRPADRLVPGAQAPRRGPVGGHQPGPGRVPVRRRLPGRR